MSLLIARLLGTLLLAASIPVSQASVNFTNEDWTVRQNEVFTFTWVYANNLSDVSPWRVVIWLLNNGVKMPPSPDTPILYNETAGATSFAWNVSCSITPSMANRIGIETYPETALWPSYSPLLNVQNKQPWNNACGPNFYSPSTALQKPTKIAIGVSMAWVGVFIIAAVVICIRRRRAARKLAGMGIKPPVAAAAIPSGSEVELQEREMQLASEEADPSTPPDYTRPSYGTPTGLPPPYSPRT